MSHGCLKIEIEFIQQETGDFCAKSVLRVTFLAAKIHKNFVQKLSSFC